MALSCPVDLDVDELRRRVEATYTRVAERPSDEFHFHTGPRFAVEVLGYERDRLAALPALATERFAGVGNPHRIADIEDGETVLDIGCGAGTDLLLAAQRVGPRGRAIGVEPLEQMRDCALRAAEQAGVAERVEVVAGDGMKLPLADASVDVVISNGVLNLATDKLVACSEIARVLKPGGRVQLADVSIDLELSEGARRDIELWAE